jgi:hypothetical protein
MTYVKCHCLIAVFRIMVVEEPVTKSELAELAKERFVDLAQTP